MMKAPRRRLTWDLGLVIVALIPYLVISAANIARLDWIIFQERFELTLAFTLIAFFFLPIIIAARMLGFPASLGICLFFSSLLFLKPFPHAQAIDVALGVVFLQVSVYMPVG